MVVGKHLKIFLCERIPSENRGEAAILEGLHEGLKHYFKDFELTIYSISSKKDEVYYKNIAKVVGHDRESAIHTKYIELAQRLILTSKLFVSALTKKIFGYELKFTDALFMAFHHADILLQGHDNIYKDKIKLKDALVVFYGKQYNKKIVVPSASIGPFKNDGLLNRSIAGYVLNNAHLITLRDKHSGDYLSNLCLKNRWRVLTDLAFMLKPTKCDIPWGEDGFVIGFTPTEFVFEKARNVNGTALSKKEFINEIITYLGWLVSELKCKVVLISHVFGPEKKQDDRIIIRQLEKKAREKGVTLDVVDDDRYTAGQLKYLIGQLDGLIACRTHTMIAALGQSVPTLALTDPGRYKTNGILGDLFESPECLFDMTSWDINQLKTITESFFQNLNAIQQRIQNKRPHAVELSQRNIQLLTEI